jgi:hypothetical protein
VKRASQPALQVARQMALALSLCLGLLGSGCGEAGEAGEADGAQPRALDTRLEAHAVIAGKPSAEGLDYLRAVAQAHREADARPDRGAQIERLLLTLEREPPLADGAAEQLHHELLARVTELMLDEGQAERALALLEPRMSPGISLPIDRASGRCLVALGDAAAQTGDHALAMSSYARALELLSLLLEEVES